MALSVRGIVFSVGDRQAMFPIGWPARHHRYVAGTIVVVANPACLILCGGEPMGASNGGTNSTIVDGP